MNSEIDRPFIYLSAGVPAETFRDELILLVSLAINTTGFSAAVPPG